MTEEQTTTPVPFSLLAWIGGFLAALCVGAIGNVIAGLAGMSVRNGFAGGVFGLIPGLVFVAIGWSTRRQSPSLSGGLIVAGCIVALVGGTCGGFLSSH
ncbi:MAG: hypothetical protein JWO97_2081 [Acidobacteria bacterium]|nr:hypothetical protein [Acidobacteriota bacterium]